MKIEESIGSLLDQEYDAPAPQNSVMHRIANAFTRNGQVKHDWNVERLTGAPASPSHY